MILLDAAFIMVGFGLMVAILRGDFSDLPRRISDNRVKRAEARSQAEIATANARAEEARLERAKLERS